MNTLPVLQKNAYLTVTVKDNHIYANLAYVDMSASRSYIISDITDLAPLKFRMDDMVFNEGFWAEYFEALEAAFGWDIVDKKWKESFKFVPFETEGYGISGIKIQVDDDQPFFSNIFASLKDFSKDISIRVVDNSLIKSLMEGLSLRLGYEDIIWLDLDMSHFSVFRLYSQTVSRGYFGKASETVKKFEVSKIDWNNEIGLVDSVRSSKLQAFIANETSSEELTNKWANFIAHSVDNVSDILLEDTLRSFTTVQLLSIRSDNRKKFEGFGSNTGKTAMILTGKIPRLLPKKLMMLSVIDGLELDGSFDLFVDNENRILSFGKNLVEAAESKDILVFKNDVLSTASKVLIPELRSGSAKNKVVYTAKIQSQDFDTREIFAINPSFEIFPIPYINNKVLVDGEFKNNTVLGSSLSHDFVSSTGGVIFDSLIVDTRFRPIVYGPKNSDNKLKLQLWLNGNKK